METLEQAISLLAGWPPWTDIIHHWLQKASVSRKVENLGLEGSLRHIRVLNVIFVY